MSADPIPADVIWARGVRYHLQAVYASAGTVALLAVIGFAATTMAGTGAQDPPITAGVLALIIGGLCALGGAVIAGAGQLRVLSAARDPQAEPHSTVAGVLERTRAGFALLPRFAIAGCIALLAAHTIWLRAGFWGAVVGTFVVIQVALVLMVIRRTILAPTRLERR